MQGKMGIETRNIQEIYRFWYADKKWPKQYHIINN
jgi:hypothetical protein